MTVAPGARLAGAPSRVLVVAAAVVAAGWMAFGSRLHATAFWLDRVLGLVPIVYDLAVVVAMIAALVLMDADRNRGRSFRVARGGFVVGPGSGYGLFVAGQTLLFGSMGQWWLTRPFGEFGGPVGASFRGVGTVVLTGFGVISVVIVLAGRPRLTLTPEGIELRHPIGGRRIGWADLQREPAVPAFVAVEPSYLAATISFYLAHPELRAGIGTAAGYATLQSGLQPVAA